MYTRISIKLEMAACQKITNFRFVQPYNRAVFRNVCVLRIYALASHAWVLFRCAVLTEAKINWNSLLLSINIPEHIL